MYQTIIEKMNSLQQTRLEQVRCENNRLKYEGGPEVKSSGLYWIYTSYSNEELKQSIPSSKRNSVELSKMMERYDGLEKVCNESTNGYRIVYNGIGGVGKKGKGGLRERILQQFRGGEGTGSLAISDTSLNRLNKWRVSYVVWEEIGLPEDHKYLVFSETLEHLWRIHYGWPVLCKK